MKYSLLVGLFTLSLAMPAQAQYANREFCTSVELIYSSGFCISPSSPLVMTLGPTGELISAMWFETSSYYQVIIFSVNSSSSSEVLLSMKLGINRDVIGFSTGNLAAAENYRSVITQGLNLVDAWEPLSDQRF